MSLQSNDFTVRIVHYDGREELYLNALLASQLMEKHPGFCVARPEVSKNPRKSLLWPEEKLLPGQKYYLIPCTTAQKLMHRRLEKVKEKQPSEVGKDESYGDNMFDVDRDDSGESVFLQRTPIHPRKGWSSCLLSRSGVKKPSLPAILKEKRPTGVGLGAYPYFYTRTVSIDLPLYVS